MSDDDRQTDPDSLPAMRAAILRIEAHSERAADYAFQAYQEVKKISDLEKRVHGLEWRESARLGWHWVALTISLFALAIALGIHWH